MSKFISYLKDTKTELSHVVWPKWAIVGVHTVIVIAISLIIGYLSGFFDSLFGFGLRSILGL